MSAVPTLCFEMFGWTSQADGLFMAAMGVSEEGSSVFSSVMFFILFDLCVCVCVCCIAGDGAARECVGQSVGQGRRRQVDDDALEHLVLGEVSGCAILIAISSWCEGSNGCTSTCTLDSVSSGSIDCRRVCNACALFAFQHIASFEHVHAVVQLGAGLWQLRWKNLP